MKGEQGFALVAALWLLVALSVLSLEFGIRAHARHLAVTNATEASRATAAADAGTAEVEYLLARLAGRGVPDPWAECEKLFGDTVAIGGVNFVVSLADANGSINLNRTNESELRRLLIALQVDAGHADRLAQTIMDWADSDELHRGRGAERLDYLRSGATILPTNRPFARLGELRQVLGMNDRLYQLVRPHVTIAGSGQVNLNSASRPVLLALPGMTEHAVALILRRRSAGRPFRTLDELANELPTAPRSELQASFASLSTRAVFETREVVATSAAFVLGNPVRVTVETLMVKAGNRALAVSRFVR